MVYYYYLKVWWYYVGIIVLYVILWEWRCTLLLLWKNYDIIASASGLQVVICVLKLVLCNSGSIFFYYYLIIAALKIILDFDILIII